MCPGLEPAGVELLEAMLVYDPAGRVSAKQACHHEYFYDSEFDHNGRPSTQYHRSWDLLITVFGRVLSILEDLSAFSYVWVASLYTNILFSLGVWWLFSNTCPCRLHYHFLYSHLRSFHPNIMFVLALISCFYMCMVGLGCFGCFSLHFDNG